MVIASITEVLNLLEDEYGKYVISNSGEKIYFEYWFGGIGNGRM